MNSTEFYSFLEPLVKEVGEYQASKWNTSLNIEYKGEINLVTEVDKKSEEMIISAIQAKYPDHDILAEEGGGQRKDSPYKWIIDPLDGTSNFAHGYPLFAISIALEHKGEILAGMVYEPLRKELFKGYRGEGAFLNDKKISVSSCEKLDRGFVATGFAYNIRETQDNNLVHFKNIILKAHAVRRDGVAAIDICYVACGRYDAFWELNLFPWDTAAAILMLEEAGGQVSCFNGKDYMVYEKEILATNTKLHGEMVEILKIGKERMQAN